MYRVPLCGMSEIRSDMDAGALPAIQARVLRPRAMLEDLNSRCMPQRPYLNVFQTCHTAEPCTCMYSRLTPYKIRMVHTCHIMEESLFVCVVMKRRVI